jgi:hypothetical protein
MEQNKRIFHAINKKVWIISLTVYAVFCGVITILFFLLGVKLHWLSIPSLIILPLLSLFIAIFPASILAVIIPRRIRSLEFESRKLISTDEFLLRCKSPQSLDQEIVIHFRQSLGAVLNIKPEKIHPEDTRYDLLFPLGVLDVKGGLDSFEIYGLMEKARRPITMEQAEEATRTIGHLETIYEKLNYLSNSTNP